MKTWGKSNKFNVAPKEDRTFFGEFRGRKQKIVFDSKKEMEYFYYLLRLEISGAISSLQIKEKFDLDLDGKFYESDFSFYFNSEFYAIDVKGVKTDVFKMKWAIVKRLYPKVNFLIDSEFTPNKRIPNGTV